jgi:hypothetical protein
MSSGDVFIFVYKIGEKTVGVPAGIIEMAVGSCLDARRGKRPLSLKALRHVIAVSEGIRWGSTQLHYLSRHRSSSSRKPMPWNTIFGTGQVGTIVQRPVSQLLDAVNTWLDEIEKDPQAVGIEYGLSIDFCGRSLSMGGSRVKPQASSSSADSIPGWSYFIAGLQFREDPHPYTAWASFGMLDLIKHDPTTGKEIDRTDIRSRETVQSANAGDIQVFRRTHDLEPLRLGLHRLRETLQNASEDMVAVTSVPQGLLRAQMETVFGQSVQTLVPLWSRKSSK